MTIFNYLPVRGRKIDFAVEKVGRQTIHVTVVFSVVYTLFYKNKFYKNTRLRFGQKLRTS